MTQVTGLAPLPRVKGMDVRDGMVGGGWRQGVLAHASQCGKSGTKIQYPAMKYNYTVHTIRFGPARVTYHFRFSKIIATNRNVIEVDCVEGHA